MAGVANLRMQIRENQGQVDVLWQMANKSNRKAELHVSRGFRYLFTL